MSSRFFSSCSECHWRSKPCRSQSQVDYAFRRHSCEKQRAATAALERLIQRNAAVDRAPKPCLHKVAEHVHGTHACYVLDRCRCLPCAAANSQYENDRSRRIAYGRGAYVDAGPARAHVLALRGQGMGLKQVAKVSGVPHGGLWKLVYGGPGQRPPSRRIRAATEQRLLAVRAEISTLAGGAIVDATGTHRRVQALVAVGWSQSKISARIGMTRGHFGKMMHAQAVSARTARAIAAVYDELWNQLPPRDAHKQKVAYSRAVNFARARRWAPPLAWDDNIDDPTAQPHEVDADLVVLDEVAIERRIAGEKVRLTPAEQLECVRRMTARGWPVTRISERLNRSGTWVRELLDREQVA
jgi:hypothetical protein